VAKTKQELKKDGELIEPKYLLILVEGIKITGLSITSFIMPQMLPHAKSLP
jgi:hypothetical protein